MRCSTVANWNRKRSGRRKQRGGGDKRQQGEAKREERGRKKERKEIRTYWREEGKRGERGGEKSDGGDRGSVGVRAVAAIRVKTELPQLDFISGVSTEQHSCRLEAFHLTKKHKQVRLITFFLLCQHSFRCNFEFWVRSQFFLQQSHYGTSTEGEIITGIHLTDNRHQFWFY